MESLPQTDMAFWPLFVESHYSLHGIRLQFSSLTRIGVHHWHGLLMVCLPRCVQTDSHCMQVGERAIARSADEDKVAYTLSDGQSNLLRMLLQVLVKDCPQN